MTKFIPGWISCFRDLMDGFREEKEMKKLYKKPVLYVERFTVDKNFASACGDNNGSYNFGTMNTCRYGDIGYFLNSGICAEVITEDVFEAMCYNGEFTSAFAS